MKLLQNKLTREIGCLVCSFGKTPEKITVVECIDGKRGSKVWYYNSLAELNEEWCDYEEPKEYWYIDWTPEIGVYHTRDVGSDADERQKEIGNYFSSEEEAEKVVKKLKALTKLCKKGFEFNSVEMFGGGLIRIEASIPINEKTTLQERSNITDSLYLLFGGKE